MRFLTSWWVVHNRFMDLGNPSKVVVNDLLILGLTYLSHQDGFPMISAPIYIVIHWAWSMVNQNIGHWVVMITKLLCCIESEPWENIELVLRSLVALTHMWDPKVNIYSLWIRLLLIKIGDNRYSQYRHHDISWVWYSVSP